MLLLAILILVLHRLPGANKGGGGGGGGGGGDGFWQCNQRTLHNVPED